MTYGPTKTVADPCQAYEYLKPSWNKARAVCNGERTVKELDQYIDLIRFSNLLIPFSTTMSQAQYDFYKSEAELPGITAQFAKMLVGGLLRKAPILTLPDEVPEEAKDWLINNIGRDDSTLVAFLDELLWEEINTSRAWVFVDYPSVNNVENLDKETRDMIKPYPILQKAETIVNWATAVDIFGKTVLKYVIVKGYSDDYTINEFHAMRVPTVWVHELNEEGNYQIRKFMGTTKDNGDQTLKIGGIGEKAQQLLPSGHFELIETFDNILNNGEPLKHIPAWPVNGNIEPIMPLLMPIVDKEISLYNKISRRNHLLYGAATYTPVIMSDMPDEQFDEIVDAGLGSWIRLRQDDKADVLKTPTDALQDMQKAIEASIDEMAKLGIRMLTTENEQSGIALEIRNAAQTAQLSVLSTKISSTLKQVICLMVNWRYGLQIDSCDIVFNLSADFDPVPLGADWLNLVTQWYQSGLLPRTVWLQMLKANDILDSEYDDEAALQEVNADPQIIPAATKYNDQYAMQTEAMASGSKPTPPKE
jgi:hypothetical protein